MEHDFEDDALFSLATQNFPFTCFPDFLYGKINAFEIAVILALIYKKKGNLRASQEELAFIAGMSESSLKRTLNSLKKKNIVNWTVDKQNGNIYDLAIQSGHTELRSGHTELTGAARLNSHLYISSSSNEEEDLEVRNKNIDNIDKNNIYSIEKKDKESLKATTPSRGAKIPERFKPVSRLLIEWWKNHRAGVKSEIAWSLLIGEFDKILADESVKGDIESISQLLYNGITSSEKGKPWQSIQYSNWSLYNKSKWIAFKESQLTVEKSPQRSAIIIPDYHKNV